MPKHMWFVVVSLGVFSFAILGSIALMVAYVSGRSNIIWNEVQIKGEPVTIVGKTILNDKGNHSFFILMNDGREQLTFQVDEKLYFHAKIRGKAILGNRQDGTRMIAGLVEDR